MTNSPTNKHLQKAFSIQNQEECRQLYREWAQTYDDTMTNELHYIAPITLASLLSPHLQDKSAPVMDLGCGTGLVGFALSKHGHSHIDGIDFSEEMIRKAKTKHCYQKLYQEDLTSRTCISDQTYHAAICAGLFTYGHLDASCLDECLRMVRIGGYFASAIRLQIWESMGFKQRFSEWEADGVITLIHKDMRENYENAEAKDGVYTIFQKNRHK